jgi:hypothetical protein
LWCVCVCVYVCGCVLCVCVECVKGGQSDTGGGAGVRQHYWLWTDTSAAGGGGGFEVPGSRSVLHRIQSLRSTLLSLSQLCNQTSLTASNPVPTKRRSMRSAVCESNPSAAIPETSPGRACRAPRAPCTHLHALELYHAPPHQQPVQPLPPRLAAALAGAVEQGAVWRGLLHHPGRDVLGKPRQGGGGFRSEARARAARQMGGTNTMALHGLRCSLLKAASLRPLLLPCACLRARGARAVPCRCAHACGGRGVGGGRQAGGRRTLLFEPRSSATTLDRP